MRAAEQSHLEGRLTARAAERIATYVAEKAGVSATCTVGLELLAPAERAAAIESAVAAVSSHGAAILSWRRDDQPARHARFELESWLGGLPVAAGLADDAVAAATAAVPHQVALDHGSLRSWQLAALLDVVSDVAAQPFASVTAARRALLDNAVVLGRHGPAAYRSVVLSSKPLPSTERTAADINPVVPDADERFVALAPAVVAALQELYLTGYVLGRDLDQLRSTKAQLQEALDA